MSIPGWGVGDIITISGLAYKVYTAYKDAPDNYKHISEEVEGLQILIDKVAQHFKSTTISSTDLEDGQKILKGCQSVLEDLKSLIEEYKSLACTNKNPVFTRIKLGQEDIATLRTRLISNTVSLNGFIQRFDIHTINIRYIILISRFQLWIARNGITVDEGSAPPKLESFIKLYYLFCLKCQYQEGF